MSRHAHHRSYLPLAGLMLLLILLSFFLLMHRYLSSSSTNIDPLPPISDPWSIWPPQLSHAPCHPRVYIYQLPPSLLPTTDESHECRVSNTNYASEVLLPSRLFDPSAPFSQLYVTSNPEEANLFYIPFMGACKLFHCWKNHNWDRSQRCDIDQQYVQPIMDYVINHLPYWNRTMGSNHVLVHPMDKRDYYYSDKRMKNATYLVTNGDRHTSGIFKETHFRSRKDLVVPSGTSPVHRLYTNPEEYTGADGNVDKRDILVLFRGCCDNVNATDAYSHGVRWAVFQHKNRPGFDVSSTKTDDEYAKLLSRAKYGISPEGWTLDTTRLWEYLAFGVVPVVIADGIVLPFENDVDWDRMIVRVRRDQVHRLESILLSIPEETWREKQRLVWTVGRKLGLEQDAWHYIVRGLCRVNELYEPSILPGL